MNELSSLDKLVALRILIEALRLGEATDEQEAGKCKRKTKEMVELSDRSG